MPGQTTAQRMKKSLRENFPNNAFETVEFWRIVGLTAFLRLLQRKNCTFL